MVKTLICLFIFISTAVCAQADYNREIQHLYHTVKRNQNMADRIATFSQQFVGKPYLLDALGEGPTGQFNQRPLYRTDKFDCLTFTSTVLSLAKSNNFNEFTQLINQVRYQNGKVAFVHRNHFTSVDWNVNNTLEGRIKNITDQFKDRAGTPIAETATAMINKPSWYKKLNEKKIHLPGQKTTPQLLAKLHAQSELVHQEKSVMLYLPLTKLFNKKGKADNFIFSQIPHGSIIEIIRPNWPLKNKIGTNLNVSHLGFAIQKNHQLIFRTASSIEHKVIDIPLTKYLHQYLDSKTVKGISVLIVL